MLAWPACEARNSNLAKKKNLHLSACPVHLMVFQVSMRINLWDSCSNQQFWHCSYINDSCIVQASTFISGSLDGRKNQNKGFYCLFCSLQRVWVTFTHKEHASQFEWLTDNGWKSMQEPLKQDHNSSFVFVLFKKPLYNEALVIYEDRGATYSTIQYIPPLPPSRWGPSRTPAQLGASSRTPGRRWLRERN